MSPDISRMLLETIRRLLRRDAVGHLQKIVNKSHPADLARVFHSLPLTQQKTLFDLIEDKESQGSLLSKLDEDDLLDFVETLPLDKLIQLLESMPNDDAADLVGRFPDDIRDSVLERMKREHSEEVGDLLQYDHQSAGGIMIQDFIALNKDITAAEAIALIQKEHEDVEMAFYLYVVDGERRLVGVCSLRQLVTAAPQTPLSDFMATDVFYVGADTDQEEVAKIVARYDLLAVPVVDEYHHVVGIVTVDDVIDIIRYEATEDILKMAGAGEDYVETKSVLKSTRSRLPWLFASCVGGLFATLAIGHFESSLQNLIYLAAFIPVIIGMGGNVGTQSSTIVVRGLATERLHLRNFWSVVSKEIAIGAILGAAYGLLMGLVAHAGYHMWELGAVVALSIAVTMVLATMVGSMLPMVFARLKVDPAVATGPFVTTAIDILGILLYFSFAKYLLRI